MVASRIAPLLVLATAAFAAASPAQAQWPSFGGFFRGSDNSQEQPGTPDWWKEHQDEAVHEPGKGYRVPGFEGFYDGQGRPMQAPVDEVVAAIRAKADAPKGVLPNLDPKLNYNRVKEAVTGGPDLDAATKLLEEAHAFYRQENYPRAAALYESAAERFPKSRVAEQALFYAAESYFQDDQLVKARDGFNRLVSEFPSTRRLDTLIDRQWRIAQYWQKYHFEYDANSSLQPNFLDKTRPTFDTIGQAIRTYDSIRLNDPTGPRADDAVMQTAGIYFAQGKYEDADYHYTLLRTDYPRSDKQFEAHLLGLQSKLRLYQGADYDGTPLEEAKKLSRRIRTHFAGRLSEDEKTRLQEVDAQLQRSVEQRELRLAKYYDNIKQYGAARQIYAEIARKYRGSPIAEESATRLAQLGGLPADPAKPMARFVALFPQNRERAKFSNIPEVQAADGGTRLATQPEAPATGANAVQR